MCSRASRWPPSRRSFSLPSAGGPITEVADRVVHEPGPGGLPGWAGHAHRGLLPEGAAGAAQPGQIIEFCVARRPARRFRPAPVTRPLRAPAPPRVVCAPAPARVAAGPPASRLTCFAGFSPGLGREGDGALLVTARRGRGHVDRGAVVVAIAATPSGVDRTAAGGAAPARPSLAPSPAHPVVLLSQGRPHRVVGAADTGGGQRRREHGTRWSSDSSDSLWLEVDRGGASGHQGRARSPATRSPSRSRFDDAP